MEYLTGDGNFHAYRYNKTDKNTDSESTSALGSHGYFPSGELYEAVWNKVRGMVAEVCSMIVQIYRLDC